MHVYRLHIKPLESDSEGEDHDEWFTSLRAAKKRRAELIRNNPTLNDHPTGCDFDIDCYEVKKLPRTALILALLNRRDSAWSTRRVEVVRPYKPREED